MVVDVVKRPGDGKEYLVVTPLHLFHYMSNLVVTICVCVNFQMALRVSTARSCPLSAGQLIVSVLSLLVLSAAARYSQIQGNVLLLK